MKTQRKPRELTHKEIIIDDEYKIVYDGFSYAMYKNNKSLTLYFSSIQNALNWYVNHVPLDKSDKLTIEEYLQDIKSYQEKIIKMFELC